MSSRVLGGALIITGTCIGAALIALPVSTAAAGFYNTLILFAFAWLVMTASAFLLLEVNLWFKEDVNLISMAKETLGLSGQVIAWISYILLLYAADAAYIAAGGNLFQKALTAMHIVLPTWSLSVGIALICGAIVYFGTISVDYLNRLFMLGLVVTYAVLVFYVSPHVEMSQLCLW